MAKGTERTHIEPLDTSSCNQLGCSAYVSYVRILGGFEIAAKCANSSEATDNSVCLEHCNEISYQAAQALWDTKVEIEKRKAYGLDGSD